jgi:hypothetical protein
MKYCPVCETTKELSEFNRNKAKKNGVASTCRECMKIYRSRYYKKNKELVMEKASKRRIELKEWLEDYKSDKKCIKCGMDHPATLDFHHRDESEKEFSIATGIGQLGKGKQSLLDEINKCDILCSNCHRILHYEERKRE